MGRFIDSLEYIPDNFIVAPRYEWRVMGVGIAQKRIPVFRVCGPTCEHYRRDLDGAPLCFDSCEYWIFDRHTIEKGNRMINLLFATNVNDPHEGFSIWLGESYLKKLLGDKYLFKLVEQYQKLIDSDKQGITIPLEE